MAEFHIEIAGKVAAVHSLFESTRDYCRAYLTEKAPDFYINVTREDLAFEQAALRQEAEEEGFRPRVFTDPFLDRASIQRKVAENLFDSNVLLFHGSALALDGKGYLFTAKSGTGKSTHTRYWREVFGPQVTMVNDDKPFLRFDDGKVLLCGAPWSGKHGLDTNITVPLKALCILDRGRENCIHPISPESAMPMLLQQSIRPLDAGKLPKYLELVDALSNGTALWHMECIKDSSAAAVAYLAMAE